MMQARSVISSVSRTLWSVYQDADSLIGEMADYLFDVMHGDRIDAGKRFVKKKEFRLDGEGSGDFGAPALAAGKRVGGLFAIRGNAEFVKKVLEFLELFGLGQILSGFENGDNILLNAELPEY